MLGGILRAADRLPRLDERDDLRAWLLPHAAGARAVHVCGIVVYPNDLLHAGRNGVATIPVAIATEMADIGDAFVAAEAVVLDAVRDGTPSVARLRDAFRESGVQMATIRAQISRER